MTCLYQFKLEHYKVMSSACGRCPYIPQDCFRPYCVPADGVPRTIDTVNLALFGPTIQVCQGDRVIVDLQNELREETSIHWHGIHQRNTPWMDGSPFITNCPIPRHSTFRYTFDTPLPGTHFWHSHSGFQRGDGVVGAFIVRRPEQDEPYGPYGKVQKLYDYDFADHELLLMDWQREQSRDISRVRELVLEDFVPNSALVNGKGMQPGFFEPRWNRVQNIGNAIQFEPMPMMPVHEVWIRQGFAYRFRLVFNGVMPCPFEVSIENHTLLVIASDGNDIVPITVDSLVVYTGERWDFIVKGNQPIGSYWIKFRGYDACAVPNATVYQVALLQYDGVRPGSRPNHFIKSLNESASPLGGTQLNPLFFDVGYKTVTVAQLSSVTDDDPEILTRERPDHKFYMSIDFNRVSRNENKVAPVLNINGTLLAPQLDSISDVMPTSPLLTQPEDIPKMNLCNNIDRKFKVNDGRDQIDTNGCRNCSREHCTCTHVIRVKHNSIVELVLVDTGEAPLFSNHPFHLHGHSFRVIGLEQLNKSMTLETAKILDGKNLLMRRRFGGAIKDSITVPRSGYTIIRFRADNRGFWFFHCHVELHLAMGMSLIFQVGSTSKMLRPPPNFPRCGNRPSTTWSNQDSINPRTLVKKTDSSLVKKGHGKNKTRGRGSSLCPPAEAGPKN